MSTLELVERYIDGPEPIERTLLLDRDPVAVAFIDPSREEVTPVWAIENGSKLEDILNSFLLTFFSDQHQQQGLLVGCWIDEEYWEKQYSHLPDDMEIVRDIYRYRDEADKLSLLNLSSDHVTMEIVFDYSGGQPSRIALFMETGDISTIPHFFAEFHCNPKIQNEEEVTAEFFRPLFVGIVEERGVYKTLRLME